MFLNHYELRRDCNSTDTKESTSKRAAPSLRSDTTVTGRARVNVAKKLKNASISFLCKESAMPSAIILYN